MMIKEFAVLICVAKLASTAPYQYNSFASLSSTPSHLTKQNFNADLPAKFNVGYKAQDSSPTTKVKKEFPNTDYQNLFSADRAKGLFGNGEYNLFDEDDDLSTSTAASLSHFPYPNQLKFDFPPNGYASANQQSKQQPQPKEQQPPSPNASSKVFVHHGVHHDKPHHFIHDVVGHYITDVAGHKLKHAGEVLESGEYTEPIIHKLFFAKAALLPLLAIIGSLSAINGINFVAKASDPHAHHPEGLLGLASGEHVEPGHSHHPHTLVGLILHFVSQLSKFNTEAKVHLIPNLLRIVSRTSSASAYASGKHPH